ncbi:MAG: hypothetical protein HYX75_05060 [Acidobacteria bacterium]|nr:hypothetical protein [Acidobacteriota bacterium]
MKNIKALVSIIICVAIVLWLIRLVLPWVFATIHLAAYLLILAVLVLLVFYLYRKVMPKL